MGGKKTTVNTQNKQKKSQTSFSVDETFPLRQVKVADHSVAELTLTELNESNCYLPWTITALPNSPNSN